MNRIAFKKGEIMAIKPNGISCNIKEQIIEDLASGLTLQIEAMGDGKTKLKIFGDIPFGNREIIFDQNGKEAATGTAVTAPCRASWLTEVRA